MLRCLLFLFLVTSGYVASFDEPPRDGRILSMFQIVRFPNEVCDGGDDSGTCYTSAECSSRGGTNSGSCASGYGVCCVFSIGCGATSSENCTYFESPGGTFSGGCQATICRCSTNICQLRLDFETFAIAGPLIDSVSVFMTKFGMATPTGTIPATRQSRCLDDTFEVTNSGGVTPPVICGQNDGEHMYVDLDGTGGCNTLNFMIRDNAAATRSWKIKVSQYSCDYNNLAPSGCTQYFFDTSGTDTVQTYNFDGGQHLADQDQTICVRRERGNCRICWYAEAITDFSVSGTATAAVKTAFNLGNMCCSYDTNGKGVQGYDCVNIPGAMKNTASMMLLTDFCGQGGLVTSKTKTATNNAMTVCTTRTPFYVRFRSDDFEFQTAAAPGLEAKGKNTGFRLTYQQFNNMC